MHRILVSGACLLFLVTGAYAQTAPSAAPPMQAAGIPGSSQVYSATTVKDFLVACHTDQGGCIDAVGSVLMDKMRFDGSSNICLSSVNYGDAVPGWLGAHPQTANMSTEDGIFTALKALYPC